MISISSRSRFAAAASPLALAIAFGATPAHAQDAQPVVTGAASEAVAAQPDTGANPTPQADDNQIVVTG